MEIEKAIAIRRLFCIELLQNYWTYFKVAKNLVVVARDDSVTKRVTSSYGYVINSAQGAVIANSTLLLGCIDLEHFELANSVALRESQFSSL